jgi:TFIIF-interacting CTD phosphatase-like protein
MSSLCLLDLDHTLIYGSYAPSENVELLFQYNRYLKVYKRPYVNDFISFLNETYDTIIVYTTAKEDYAIKICNKLNVRTTMILSRSHCIQKNENYYKKFSKDWGSSYKSIHIIDDSPNVWLKTEPFENKIDFIIPREFRGEVEDKELLGIMSYVKSY